MTPDEVAETRRALRQHEEVLQKTLTRHDRRRLTWVDRGLGSWEEARRNLLRRVTATRTALSKLGG